MRVSFFPVLLVALVGLLTAKAELVIVDNGQPKAQIIIAEEPPRLTRLAAEELRDYVRKISGAELPILTQPTAAAPIKIYVGQSAYTDDLDVQAKDLRHDAYKMVSGDDWLVLIGYDADFTPIEPYPKHHRDNEKVQQEWEAIYGGHCANPMAWYGGPSSSHNKATDTWRQDAGGSLQAVYALLRDFGVRWYMPGETGEIVPTKQTLTVDDVNRTVKPDFAMRNPYWYNRFHMALAEDVLWWRRVGFNDQYSTLGAGMQVHGMRLITSNEWMQTNHPEYYALYGGKRDTEYRGSGHACFNSKGLEEETIKYLRAVFDHYDEPAMDLWPQDAYHACGCEMCKDESPSNLVFGFVNRVATELYKTHPDKLITCGAYTAYMAPPTNIDKFSPNVAVFLSNRGRPTFDNEERWNDYWESVSGWREKLAPGHIIRGENNLYNERLVIHPRAYAKDLRALKGISMGDLCEIPRGRSGQTQWANPGINHLNYYVQARLLWDVDIDLDALLDEYYTRFYGPAAAQMKDAFEYAEQNYDRLRAPGLNLEQRVAFVQKLHAARDIAGVSIHGQRIQTIIDELPPLDDLRAELEAKIAAGDPRQDAPTAIGRDLGPGVEPPVYEMVTIVEGEKPDIKTTFHVGWQDDHLVFDITCFDPEMEDLYVTPDVWGGDSVAILLETPYHSYYQIEVNPDGQVFDADRQYGRVKAQWTAQIKTEVERGANFWRVVARIPVVPVAEGQADPLHNVVGPKPSVENPWWFNIGRTRVRGPNEDDRTPYTYQAVGSRTYHNTDRFAKLVIQ